MQQEELDLRAIDGIIESISPAQRGRHLNLSIRDRARLAATSDQQEDREPAKPAVAPARQARKPGRARQQSKPCRSFCGGRR